MGRTHTTALLSPVRLRVCVCACVRGVCASEREREKEEGVIWDCLIT